MALISFAGGTATIEESLLTNAQVIRDSAGWVTHRIERSVFGDKLIITDVATGAREAVQITA